MATDIENPGSVANNLRMDEYVMGTFRRLKKSSLLKVNWTEETTKRTSQKRQKTIENNKGDGSEHSNKAEYQKNAFLFQSSFGGKITLEEIASLKYGYTFTVPGYVMYSMLAAFKCKATIYLHRRRMARLSTAKTVFITSCIGQKGTKIPKW